MKSKIYLLTATICAGFLFCSFAAAQKIVYDFVADTDFSKYKTYKWHRAAKAIYPAKDLDDMFIRTIDAEIAKKGLARVESEEADLVVTYQIAVLDDMEWSSSKSTIPWVGVVGMNPGITGATVSGTNMIKKGSFFLDFYDVKTARQIWQAHATKTLAKTDDIKKRENNTKKVMAKIFQTYPPRAK
ncbi:MAG: DUF4136 domain-containing protein [Saprospiraceae bacterium]|nr:DUF4136 domain-containing protein [Pyrinomonadaceae bacterium]